MSETELIHRILKGNTHAFETLVNAYKTMVYSLALRLCNNHEEAEELTQDVFLRVYDNLSSFKGESKLKTWIYRIAFNWCMNKTKTKRAYEKVAFESHFQLAEVEMNAFEQLAHEELNASIREALKQLDRIDALVLTMFYLDEMSVEEIAHVLSFSKPNIKVKLFRARKKLKEIIESNQYWSHE